MAEYIEREALGIWKCNPDVFEDKGYAKGWNAAIDIIQSAPAADVRPVARGQEAGRMSKPKPCPFCGEELVWEEYECALTRQPITLKYWKHPQTMCFASGFEVYPDDVPAWNRRAKR